MDGINVSNSLSARSDIDTIDGAITDVSNVRTALGAYLNGLEHALNSNNNYKENLIAARSRILDADMAKEMMDKVKNDILMQTSQILLAQANTTPEYILMMLR